MIKTRIEAARARDQRHADLVDRIVREQPGAAAAADEWTFTIELRKWAYRNIRRQTEMATLLDYTPGFELYSRDAPDIFAAFANDVAGVVGGGCGFALMQLYRAFGFEALMIDCGSVEDGFTRISTVCPLTHAGQQLRTVHDPNYDFSLARPDGGPIDFLAAIDLLVGGRGHEVLRLDGDPQAHRESILHPSQSLDEDWTIPPNAEPLRVLADGRRMMPSHMTMARYAERAVESKEFLQRRGLSEDLLQFYRMVFAVYPQHLPEAGDLFAAIQRAQGEGVAKSGAVSWEGPRFDKAAYEHFGVFVVRDLFPTAERDRLTAIWDAFYQNKLARARAVGAGGAAAQDLCETAPDEIAALYRHPVLIELMRELYGDDIVFCQQRILIKDAHFVGGVPPHQDVAYYRGGSQKTGLFVPLTVCSPSNGGLHFFPGSHKLGYFGDRGYIPYDRLDGDDLPTMKSICPTLRPGDVALMDLCTLHFSRDMVTTEPRVYVNPYYQPATDGSYETLLCGQWRTDVFWSTHTVDKYLKTNDQIYAEQIEAARART